MTKKLIPLSLALGFALTGISSAAIVGGDTGAYTFSASPVSGVTSATNFNLKQFDSSLGTLTGVRVDLVLTNWDGVYTYQHTATGTLQAEDLGNLVNGTYGIASPKLNFAGFTGGKVQANVKQFLVTSDTEYMGSNTEYINGGDPVSASNFYSNTSTAAAWAATNGLIGTGNFTLNYSSSTAYNLAVIDGGTNTLTTNMAGDVKAYVTYTYTPAGTPEPAGLLLGGAPALLGAAHLLRRRRR